jgi:hypothetical protein
MGGWCATLVAPARAILVAEEPTVKRSIRKAVSLFDTQPHASADPRAVLEAKVRSFARAVAERHRTRPADLEQLLVALHGYYRALALFGEVPRLDEGLVATAVAEYGAARRSRRAAA